MHNLILLARPAIRQSISPSTHDTHPDRPRRDAAAAGATPTTTLPSGIYLRLVILSLDWTGSVPSLPHLLQCIYLQSTTTEKLNTLVYLPDDKVISATKSTSLPYDGPLDRAIDH